jgi:carbamoyltransferase
MQNVVLSGGVVANVKANQRIFEIDGVKKIYIHPNMGDGGCCVGAALAVARKSAGLQPEELSDVYWGQEYSDNEIGAALEAEGLDGVREDDIELSIAQLLADGNIVARFNGRMEYGPRSLGNRSILYHAKDPSVNLWLNQKLKRTEFMPFAPATLYEERHN